MSRANRTFRDAMLTGELRSQIDAIWSALWAGGISNPMEMLDQITYPLCVRRLHDAHTLGESKALMVKRTACSK